jgi:predicted acyltransferase
VQTVTERSERQDASRTQTGRVLSLDTFRGATIAAMILVNDPGNSQAIYEPFEHADWHGWTFTDTVFPFFLWIVGVSITFSFAKRIAQGADRGRLLLHVLKRSALIFLIGLLLNGFPRYNLSTLRIPGVLQRIAVCYLIGATIFLFTKSIWSRIAWIAGLLTSYWVLMMYVGGGVLDTIGNLAQKVDAAVLSGHMWSQTKIWDPEGIVSTLPAIATVLLGILAGQLLRTKRTAEEKTSWMFLGGNLLILAGLILSTWMPINKKLWTDSFTLFMGGLAWVVFACWYWIVDVKGWERWARPFAIFGMNAIVLYVCSGVIARLLGMSGLWRTIYENVFAPIAPAKLASLQFAFAYVILHFAIAYFMYRRRWFVRL